MSFCPSSPAVPTKPNGGFCHAADTWSPAKYRFASPTTNSCPNDHGNHKTQPVNHVVPLRRSVSGGMLHLHCKHLCHVPHISPDLRSTTACADMLLTETGAARFPFPVHLIEEINGCLHAYREKENWRWERLNSHQSERGSVKIRAAASGLTSYLLLITGRRSCERWKHTHAHTFWHPDHTSVVSCCRRLQQSRSQKETQHAERIPSHRLRWLYLPISAHEVMKSARL